MSTWEWLVIMGGVAAAFWRQFKEVVGWLRSWFVTSHRTDPSTGLLLLSYMNATSRRLEGREGGYGSMTVFVRPLDRLYRVLYQNLSASTQVFWRRLRPLWYRQDQINTSDPADYSMRFSFVRGTYDWEALLIAAATWEDHLKQGHGQVSLRFCVRHHHGSNWNAMLLEDRKKSDAAPLRACTDAPYSLKAFSGTRLLQWSLDDVQGETVVSTMDHLSLRPELASLVEEIRFWHRSQLWYAQRGIPWRRGYLLHGRPGTGKTSFTRAVAEMLDMPVHVFDLSSMSNQDLRQSWREMLTTAPCVALFEDLDGVFEGRTNTSNTGSMTGGGLTFDCLLNCMDGIERVDGVLLVVSTNNIDKLDPALVDRPGRIDSVVEFLPLDYDGRVKLARRILDDADLVARVVADGEADSASAFQERCFRIALGRLFSLDGSVRTTKEAS